MPFDEDPDLPVHARIRSRLDQDFDRELLMEIDVSEQGIDFIGKLLEKDPAKRLRLVDALEHPWLSMGQDSMPASYGHSYGLQDGYATSGGRSRASTVNDFNGNDNEDTPRLGGPSDQSSSADDYSFPMTNLRLQTPGVPRASPMGKKRSVESLRGSQRLMAGQSSFFGGESEAGMEVDGSDLGGQAEALPRHRRMQQVQPPQSLLLQESPPSPPLTDSASSAVGGLADLVRDGPPGIRPSRSIKRKLSLDSASSGSSDLSDAPESDPQAQPIRKVDNEADDGRPAKRANTNQIPPTRSSARIKRNTTIEQKASGQTTPKAKTAGRRGNK